MGRNSAPFPERFWQKVAKADGCWSWTSVHQSAGYGTFKLNGTMVLAHRVAYQLLKGPIPAGMQLDHLCRNRGCVNPDHLEPVTREENLKRSPRHPSNKGFCPQGHPYSGDNLLLWDRKGTKARVCRECHRQRNAARYAKKMLDPEFREKERLRTQERRARFARTGPNY
jgi:hypothetical protein